MRFPPSCPAHQFSFSTPSRLEAITADKQDPSAEGAGVDFQRPRGALIERGAKPARAGLVCPYLRFRGEQRSIEARSEEFVGLAGAISLEIVFSQTVLLREVRAATYVGGGIVEELAERVKSDDIELVLVDAQLSPIQQRNLERAIGAKVLDRTALILEIFGERAVTREGELQVELAHLNYQKGRLVRSWTHLERQRGAGGGRGFLGGPGETQIESDRRQLQERIALLEQRLEKVRRTRGQQRKSRGAVPFPVVALVGYTNAGKSSLFNRMTGADVSAKDLLFATLDTTVRRVELPHGRQVILSDTVGFVADLPTELIAAFRATLEEVTSADVVLHVRDVSNPDHRAQAEDVLSVLNDLGVKGEQTPIIEVWNKIDRLAPGPGEEGKSRDELLALHVNPIGTPAATVPVSAVTGEGVDKLLLAIEAALAANAGVFRVVVPHEQSQQLGWLYATTEVLERGEPTEQGTPLTVRVQPRDQVEFGRRFGGLAERLSAA